MPATTFFWHDYETFGRDPRRDRPVQFAGVRTNAELDEVAPPVMWHCRPADDFLPDPESVLITGITPQQALAQGLAECEFASRIEAELARECTVGVGYNNIRFDDEVTRFLFWRSLIDPYGREWQNSCGRWDLLDTVRCAWSLRPDGIEWPLHPQGSEWAGRPSFRLEHLTAANGITHAGAHDALCDVRATIALARLVRERQPRLWDFCLRLHKKDAVWDQIGIGRPFAHVSRQYPVERGCLAVVWPLAQHPTNKNELIVWDLAHDPGELAALDVEAVRRRLFTRGAELEAAGEQRLPIKTIHLNKSPIVIGNLATVRGAAERWGLDLVGALRHAEGAPAASAAAEPLWPEVYRKPAPAEPPDIDCDLYGALLGDADRRRLQRLRTLDPVALAAQRPAFDDARLDELVFRFRARNHPQTLDADERARWERHRADRLHRGAGGGPTLAAYFERLDALAEEAAERDDARAQALLEALYDHAAGMAPELS